MQRQVKQHAPLGYQRGIVAVAAVLFLIAVVAFVLMQTLNISGSATADNSKQLDSVAALFVAESGLESGTAALAGAYNPTDKSACVGAAMASTSVGRGNYTVSALVEGCDSNDKYCETCTLTSTGTVGSPPATRTVSMRYKLNAANGTFCNAATSTCTTPSLKLKNIYGNTAVAVFSLAAKRQGDGDSAACSTVTITGGSGTAGCYMAWNLNASNGSKSVGSMGAVVTIDSGVSATIDQTLNSSRSYVEVGALFPGTTAPQVVGTYAPTGTPPIYAYGYWNEPSSGSGGTIGKSGDFSGVTNNGTATGGSCTSVPVTGGVQTCTNWCTGGDTLVFGFAGNSGVASDALTSVVFDSDVGGLAMPLSNIVKYPTGATAGAPNDVESEIWYARNRDYLSDALSASSGGTFTALAGLPSTAFRASLTTGATSMEVTYLLGYVSVGDRIYCPSTGSGCTAGQLLATVTAVPGGGTRSNLIGTYTVSASTATVNPPAPLTVQSQYLRVSAFSKGYLSVNDVLSNGASGKVLSVPTASVPSTCDTSSCNGAGDYLTDTYQQFVSTSNLSANGYTIHVSGGTVPAGGIPFAGTIVRVRDASPGQFDMGSAVVGSFNGTTLTVTSGTVNVGDAISGNGIAPGTQVISGSAGVYQVNNAHNTASMTLKASTAIQSVPTPTATKFLVSRIPSTRLDGATICGGTCALFNPVSSTTTFSLSKGTGLDYWASGFTCLKGADLKPLIVIVDGKAVASTWHELIAP